MMQIAKLSRILGFLLFLSFNSQAQSIKVACVGNSVTYGMGINSREDNSYPAQLQKLLGNDYDVKNFGFSGATMLKNGHKPYWTKSVFKESQVFQPDIVVIHLGLNDQGNNNWPEHKDEFFDDYLSMIGVYQNLNSKPKIYLCKMSPTLSGHHWFEEGMRENFKEIQSKIEEIASKTSLTLIDLHEPLYRFPEYLPDNLHPTKEGAIIIANKVYSSISGDYGGLQLPVLFGENMVMQQGDSLNIYGKADANTRIEVKFDHDSKSTEADINGFWNAKFDVLPAGGPYSLDIKTSKNEHIHIKKVFVGEVWLASGQSNMAFQMKNIGKATEILHDSIHPNIHLFSMRGAAWPDSGKFTKEQLLSCNAESYFKSSGWLLSSTETVASFSAVAYSFAFQLQKELGVPIGIICNAVGGSTTQSWISRESMELQHQTIDLLNDTHNHSMVQPWVNQRKMENFKDLKEYGIKARHPFDPTFLFDAGIVGIKSYSFRGVLWYQGESNAERPRLHSLLFKTLVNDWRMHFQKLEMPFYYVQLSSLNRPSWGQFRDSQRRLLEIPNTGMAVTLDLGDRKNVHPKRKWKVGERLSKIALNNDYAKNIEYSGPLFDYVNINSNKMLITFKHCSGLKTMDNEKVKDIEVAGFDQVFQPANAVIVEDKLEVWSESISHPRYVRYGYTPYSEGNLINYAGLPASTFSNLNE